MPTTQINNLRYPLDSDPPNGPLQIGNLAADVDPLLIPRVASIAARTAKFPSPQQNNMCMVAGRLHTYDGSSWRFANEGFKSATSDASGYVTVAHGLGQAPTGVIITPGDHVSDLLDRVASLVWTGSADAVNFVARLRRNDTNAWLGSNPTTFSWRAFV